MCCIKVETYYLMIIIIISTLKCFFFVVFLEGVELCVLEAAVGSDARSCGIRRDLRSVLLELKLN